MSFLHNLAFDTWPIAVHAQGDSLVNPCWPEIRDRFLASPPRRLGAAPGLTILTWNNGAPGLGLAERSLDHMGVPYRVLGAGIEDWLNSRDKPRSTLAALEETDTPYVMGMDSRDAILVDDPRRAVEIFESELSCGLVFNAQKVNWPNLKDFRVFEQSRPGAETSEFRFLNGGLWIGRTDFCRIFFTEACRTEPVEVQPGSEQGILKQLFLSYHPQVQLDYRCRIFQTLEYVFTSIFDFGPAAGSLP